MIIGVLLSAEQLSQRHFSLVLEPDDSPIFWEGLNGFPPNINILDWGKWRRLVVVGCFILDFWTALFVLPSLNARTFSGLRVSCLGWEGSIGYTCCRPKAMLSFVRNNSRNFWARCRGKELVVYSVVVDPTEVVQTRADAYAIFVNVFADCSLQLLIPIGLLWVFVVGDDLFELFHHFWFQNDVIFVEVDRAGYGESQENLIHSLTLLNPSCRCYVLAFVKFRLPILQFCAHSPRWHIQGFLLKLKLRTFAKIDVSWGVLCGFILNDWDLISFSQRLVVCFFCFREINQVENFRMLLFCVVNSW